MSFIYKIVNIINQDFYIGKTERTIDIRFNEHVKNANNMIETYLYRSMRKYGLSNFIIDIIEEVDINQLNEREIFYIDKLKPTYNMTLSGDGGGTTHNRMWINNGITNLYILKEDDIPDGYVKGRINCKFNDVEFQKEMSRRVDRSCIDYKERSRKGIITRKINGTQRDISGENNPTRDPKIREKMRQSALNRPMVKCDRCGK